MAEKKSIMTAHPVTAQTPPSNTLPKVGWDVNRFNGLIQNHGYDVYIEKALRCPCVDRATGQALSTCKNCLGRGWFFVDRRETRLVAQGMENLRRNEQYGEVNRGLARITARAVDKLGFMDRIIMRQLEAYYTEIIRPFEYGDELVAYPVYEPLFVTNMYLYVGDTTKLLPIPEEMYRIEGNKIVFDSSLADEVPVEDMNERFPHLSISIRYAYNPTYHIIDGNRELTKVREFACSYSDETLKQVPILMLARKAHYIFDAQKFDNDLIDNSVVEK